MPKKRNVLSLLACVGFALTIACGSNPPRSTQAPAYGSTYGDARAPSSTQVRAGASAPRASVASRAAESESLASDQQERPGLGTRFGENRSSEVVQRRFVRSGQSPFATVAIHYNNLAGIQQQSAYQGTSLSELRARTQGGGISISLLDEAGRLLQGGTGAGRTYVVGHDNQRYTIQIRNDSGGRFEVVSSVDGLDVVDGLPANFSKRGYIISPYSTLEIEGFRTSMETVAAFRFGAVKDSYAAQTSGDRNVGVIGFAFFSERGSEWTSDEIRRRETANPFPGEFSRPPAVVR